MFNNDNFLENFPGGIPPLPPPEDDGQNTADTQLKELLENERRVFVEQLTTAEHLLTTLEVPDQRSSKIVHALRELKDFVWSQNFISGFGSGVLMLIALDEQRGVPHLTPEQFLEGMGWFGATGGVAAETMYRIGKDLKAKIGKKSYGQK